MRAPFRQHRYRRRKYTTRELLAGLAGPISPDFRRRLEAQQQHLDDVERGWIPAAGGTWFGKTGGGGVRPYGW